MGGRPAGLRPAWYFKDTRNSQFNAQQRQNKQIITFTMLHLHGNPRESKQRFEVVMKRGALQFSVSFPYFPVCTHNWGMN